MISDPERGSLFIALPESAEIAVVHFKGGPYIARKIPVERGIRRLIWADGLLWGLASDLFAINPETLKVQVRYDLQGINTGGADLESIITPTDMAWVPRSALGNELGSMIVTGADGEFLILPPEREEQLKFARSNRHHCNHIALSLERNQFFFTDHLEGELLVTPGLTSSLIQGAPPLTSRRSPSPREIFNSFRARLGRSSQRVLSVLSAK